MKIEMLQLNFFVGDVEGNARKIIQGYKKASAEGAEIVVSTELGLLGYPPRDLLLIDEYLELQDKYLDWIKSQVGETMLIVGVAERSQLPVGMPLFNSAVVIWRGRVIHTQRKSLLPNYDVFDERRYFEPFTQRQFLIPYPGKKIALLICEDIWGGVEILNGRDIYEFDPLADLRSLSLDALIVINASPYFWGKGQMRLELVAKVARDLNCPVVYANQVGANDELIFDGQSFAVNREGACLAQAQPFIEDAIMVDLDAAADLSFRSDKDSLEHLNQALVLGVRDYLTKIGNTRGVIIGLSGGIDSALTACLAVEALGPEKVLGVAMPSMYSSQGSIVDAQALADNLGIVMDTDFIGEIYQAYANSLVSKIQWLMPGEKPGDVTEENIQARIRGNILMAYSNRSGRIVLTTGNKSELAVGYCTLYGDMAGGLAVISDLPKTLVYRLANHLNRRREIIPYSTIHKPPSAELRPDQKDTDSLPPYDLLDHILHLYVEEQRSPRKIAASMPEQADIVHRVVSMVNRSEFKRRQMAPGLRVTSKAFGGGWRMPVAACFLS